MPVGTRATVRGLHPDALAECGADMVLANTYHLWVRPGADTIRALGGLHRFMAWKGPILTDSGGYQVFSLGERIVISERGVRIRDPDDGVWRELTPEIATQAQEALDVDVAMAFDECLEHPATRERAAESTARTTRWLKRCLAARTRPDRTALFGILQGGLHEDLRVEHAQELTAMDLDGYAIGGLSVGEDRKDLVQFASISADHLPGDKVRYLMGVGHPVDIADSVLCGVDLFDCVLPTRAGRHGQAYTRDGRRNLKNARYRDDPLPLDPQCGCPACARFSRAYLRHLHQCDEILGKQLVSLHNLWHYQSLVADLREAIESGDVDRLANVREGAAVATRVAAD
jgi:queuine tRNA-ribosyltransferase